MSYAKGRLRAVTDLALYRASIPGTWVYLPVLLMALVGLNYHRDHPTILAAFTVLWIFGAAARLVVGHLAIRHHEQRPELWRWLFRGAILLTPLTWGLFSALTFVLYGPTWDTLVCVMVCAGFSGGGTAAYHSDWRLQRPYVLLLWVPNMVVIAFRPALLRTTFVLLTLMAVFLAYLLKLGAEQASRYWRAVKDRLVTEQLIQLTSGLVSNLSADELVERLAQSLQPVLEFEEHWVGEPRAGANALSTFLGTHAHGQLRFFVAKADGFASEDAQALALFAGPATAALDRLRMFEQVDRLARIDSLTGVSNRLAFFEKANELVRTTRRLAEKKTLSVILLDVDHFKKFNDTHGHDVGDLVLKHVALRCRNALREIDVFARYGGEEFVVLLPGANLQEAASLAAERMRRAVCEQPIAGPNGPLTVSISLGVAELGELEARLEDVLKRADQALYAAKAAGRNCVQTSGGVLA